MDYMCNPQSQYQTEESPTILDKRSWDSIATFIFFCHNLGSLLKQWILFKILLQFSLPPPPPYTKLKTKKKKFGVTRPTLFVGREEGLDLCEMENAPEEQKFPKTFVHDFRYYSLENIDCAEVIFSSRNSIME